MVAVMIPGYADIRLLQKGGTPSRWVMCAFAGPWRRGMFHDGAYIDDRGALDSAKHIEVIRIFAES